MQRALHLRMNGRESDPGEPVFMSRSPWLQPLESGHFVRIPVELVLVPVWGFVRIRMQVCIVIARPTLNSITQDFVQSIALVKVIYGYRVNTYQKWVFAPIFQFFFFSIGHANKKKGKDKLDYGNLIIQSIRFGICRTINIFFE